MKKIATIWTIVLLISLPIYVCATLDSISVKGLNGIEGYARTEDELRLEVKVSGVDHVSPTDVFFAGANPFSQCQQSPTGYYICSLAYRLPSGTEAGVMSPYVTYNDEQISGSLVIDGVPPEIKSINIVPPFGNAETVNIAYKVTDKSCSHALCTSYCAGIQKVELYKDDELIETQDIDSEDCSYDGELSYTTDKIEGSETICLLPYDRVGNEAEEKVCKSFTIDKIAPTIDPDSLLIKDQDDNEIDYLALEALPVTVSIKIAADDLDPNNVYGDFSEISSLIAKQKASCNAPQNNITECSWQISLSITDDGDKNIIIEASDMAGNKDTKTITKNFAIDETGPLATSLRTSNYFDSTSYAKSNGNTIIVELTEDQSGIDNDDVKIRLKNPETNRYTSYIADDCNYGYKCYFYDVPMPTKEGLVFAEVSTDTTDIIGNRLIEAFSDYILVDSTIPIVKEVEITSLGGEQQALPVIKTGDSIKAVVTIKEENGIASAFMDASAFSRNGKNISGDCSKAGSGQYTCTFTSPAITASSYTNDDIKFFITDYSGNTLQHQEKIESFSADDTAQPDYWNSMVRCSPSKIDRQVTPLIQTKVYCHLDLTPKMANPEIVQTQISGCSGDVNILAVQPTLENNEYGSVDPYIIFEIAANRYLQDSMNISCPVRIISKVGNEITINPEIEQVSITLPFYSSALGEYGEAVQDKIDEAKDGLLIKQKWIGTLNQILHYGERACQLVGTLVKAYGVLSSVGMMLGVMEKTLPDGGVLTGADAARRQIQETQQGVGYLSKKGWGNTVNKLCKFFSCRLYFDDIKWLAGDKKEDENTGFDTEAKTDEKKGFFKNFKGWGSGIASWQRSVFEKANWVATGGGVLEGVGIGGDDTQGNIQAWGDGSTGTEVHIQGGKLNPKESIVMSALTLCIPGILYNLEKLRQIECMHVDCMENLVPQGLPLQSCDDAKHYSTCKYWTGELFQLLPFTGLISYFSDLVKGALSSPYGIVDTALAFACETKIVGPNGISAQVCLINDMLGLGADVFQDLKGITEGWKLQNDYCKNIDLDDKDDEEEDSQDYSNIAQSDSLPASYDANRQPTGTYTGTTTDTSGSADISADRNRQ